MPLVIAVTAIAFVLRLVSAVEMASFNGTLNSVFHPSKASDLATYMTLAQQLQQQRVFSFQQFIQAKEFVSSTRLH